MRLMPRNVILVRGPVCRASARQTTLVPRATSERLRLFIHPRDPVRLRTNANTAMPITPTATHPVCSALMLIAA